MKMSMEYPCVYFEKDGKCRKFSDDTVISYCVMGPCLEQKLSNGDRIRAMSDEELAKFISIQSDDCLCSDNSKCDYHCGGDSCLKVLLDWLQQPAEEDT